MMKEGALKLDGFCGIDVVEKGIFRPYDGAETWRGLPLNGRQRRSLSNAY